MITALNFNNLRQSEVIAYINDVLTLLKAKPIKVLAAPTKDLLDIYTELDKSFKVSQGSAITMSIQELDAKRDAALTGIRNILKGYGYHADEAVRKQSLLLQKCIDKYGDRIVNLNYQAQTIVLKNIMDDISADADMGEAIATIHLKPWFDEMALRNSQFEQKYLERVAENAHKQVVPYKELRPKALDTYRALVKHIEANELLHPSAELGALVAQINELVRKYSAL